MSKHLLNSVILIMLLIILLGGGFYFIQERYNADIIALREEYKVTSDKYEELLIAKQELPEKIKSLEEMKYELENYPIMLMKRENIHRVYQYFEKYDKFGPFFEFNYKISNILEREEVVEANYNLSGVGDYSKLMGFINYLEYSPPLFFIDKLTFKQSKDENAGDIKLDFKGIFSKNTPTGITSSIFTVKTYIGKLSFYNPFSPLILWNLPPNENNLPDVRYNKLLALTENTAYFKSINGEINSVNIGDEVYLGTLNSIDTDQGVAVFFMNYGGIYNKLIRSIYEKPENAR
ncbi:MAG: hypothetical protein JXQ65_04210 [Candidatus Marinimicrobia bacterium]|nr:hypothetical protein [Candidatus Neomarinimicrobiota bacterium]